jgi:hypothetical protein
MHKVSRFSNSRQSVMDFDLNLLIVDSLTSPQSVFHFRSLYGRSNLSCVTSQLLLLLDTTSGGRSRKGHFRLRICLATYETDHLITGIPPGNCTIVNIRDLGQSRFWITRKWPQVKGSNFRMTKKGRFFVGSGVWKLNFWVNIVCIVKFMLTTTHRLTLYYREHLITECLNSGTIQSPVKCESGS